MGYRIGVDIGGTFTDFCVFDEGRNELHTLKVLSTPANPGQEVITGLRELQVRYGVDPAAISYFTHGQTVGVNTVIQRNGARLALLVTENFRDVLEFERLRLPDAFNLRAVRPPPLVPRDRVLQVCERIDASGAVIQPLDEDTVRAAAREARALGAEGVVVAFLNSYRNPAHEQAALAGLERAEPGLFRFASSGVWPVIREFERTITAVLNGYVHPKVAHYLGTLQEALRGLGVPARAMVAKSNGGVMSAERGKQECVQILLSGTASGVMGAAHVAAQAGARNAISLDIGGTSADVALIIDGEPQYGVGEHVGDFALYIPSVSVSSIGAGGGSLGWVDRGGLLHVGPESAGADPGPACYGRGTRAALSDAFAVCGLLGHSDLAYQAVQVDRERARRAVGELAGQLGRTIEETAQAMIDVAVSEMYLELSKLMARYGADPREFVLIPFGGAGPMLAGFLARELDISHVLVPATPGVLSALGGLIADVKNDFIRTVYLDLTPEAIAALGVVLESLREEALAWHRDELASSAAPELRFSADMRYVGQSFEIEVPLAESMLTQRAAGEIAAAFHAQHQRIYGHSDPAAPVQLINLRLVLMAPSPKPQWKPLPPVAVPPRAQAQLDGWLDGRRQSVPLYRRTDLGAGAQIAGPAVLAQDDATTIVLEGFSLRTDAYGNCHLERSGP